MFTAAKSSGGGVAVKHGLIYTWNRLDNGCMLL